MLRREQDSNLRTGFAGYTLSRRASSTTRAPLLCVVQKAGAKVIILIEICERKIDYFMIASAFLTLI